MDDFIKQARYGWRHGRNRAPKTWHAVLRQDPCVYCHTLPLILNDGTRRQTLDHIVPKVRIRAMPERTGTPNLAPACQHCNWDKTDQDLLQYLLSRGRSDRARRP